MMKFDFNFRSSAINWRLFPLLPRRWRKFVQNLRTISNTAMVTNFGVYVSYRGYDTNVVLWLVSFDITVA
jgi:hypothetical protein